MQPPSSSSVIAELAPHAPTERLRAAARARRGQPVPRRADRPRARRRRHRRSASTPSRAGSQRLDARRAHGRRDRRARRPAARRSSSCARSPSCRRAGCSRCCAASRTAASCASRRRRPAIRSTSFYHQRLRDAAHGRDDAPTRGARVHRRFAAWLEREAGRRGSARVSLAARRRARRAPRAGAIAAADAARAQLAWGLAADWYGRALELGADSVAAPAARRVPVPRRQARRRGDRVRDARRARSPTAIAGACAPPSRTSSSASSSAALAILDGVLARRGQPRAQRPRREHRARRRSPRAGWSPRRCACAPSNTY